MRQWDVYWAEVQFEDSDEVKMRPVVILNDTTAFIVGLGVYSASPRPGYRDYMIRDWRAAGLDHLSTIHLDRMIRIRKENVQDRIGRLSEMDILLVKHNMP